jgi:hypothetical protein
VVAGSMGAPVTLDQYFALPDTPMKRSPVGKAMRRVLGYPAHYDFPRHVYESTREGAHERLYGFSKRSKRLAIPLPRKTLRG